MRSGEASTTARRVAAHRLGFDRVPGPAGDPDADDRLARDVAGTVDVSTSGERMVAYLRARTAFFDRAVVEALADGVPQVVVAAAGYDARSLRYGAPGARWFELDHPDTQADKRARLDRLAIDASAVTFVAADFTTDDVAAALLAAGLDPAAPALFTVEGVVAYLDRPTTHRLFGALASVAAPRSRLAVSVSTTPRTAEGATRRATFQRSVAAMGEAASDPLTADDALPLLADHGWTPDGTLDDRRRHAGLLLLHRP